MFGESMPRVQGSIASSSRVQLLRVQGFKKLATEPVEVRVQGSKSWPLSLSKCALKVYVQLLICSIVPEPFSKPHLLFLIS